MQVSTFIKGILLIYFGFVTYSIASYVNTSYSIFLVMKSVGSALSLAGFGLSITGMILRKNERYKENPMEPLKNCLYCRAKMPSDAMYCGRCGKNIIKRGVADKFKQDL